VASKLIPLTYHCKTADGWKRLPVVFHDNAKLHPRHATVGGTLVKGNKGRLVAEKPVEYSESYY
jgi:hypothetical protein